MINNFQSMLPSIFCTLDNSEFTFYPTGSRYFGGYIGEDTDWDFFVEDSLLLHTFLTANGFILREGTGYGQDKTITVIYSYYSNGLATKGKTSIDIQVIKPDQMNNKQLIQKILKDRYGEFGLPGEKHTRAQIWQLMFHTLEELGKS